ncbi:MAG: hypothetical protein P1U78_08980 [Alcanivoracaceae bacterium]|nr:hypothetical protein [Alcanivoracaceae bacterium]
MSEARFNVIFAGQIVAGADPSKVRENLAAAFRMDMAKVEGLFSGKRVVVKKDADQATAMKFRAVMKQAGAQAELERVVDPSEPAAAPAAAPSPAPAPAPEPATQPAAEPAVAASQPAAVSGGSLETVGTIRTSGTGFSGPFAVAPTGTDLAVERNLPPPVVPDVSHLSVAPAGADMGEKREEKPPVTPDISHLKIDPL